MDEGEREGMGGGSYIVIERHVAVRHWARKRAYNNGIIAGVKYRLQTGNKSISAISLVRFMGLVIAGSSALTIMENEPRPDSFRAPPNRANLRANNDFFFSTQSIDSY